MNNAAMGTVLVLPFSRFFKKLPITNSQEGGLVGTAVVLTIVDVINRGMPFPPPQSTGLIPSFAFGSSDMELVNWITPLVTLGMLLVLVWQTRILSKQSRLASGPSIFPRFVFNDIDNKIHIHLFNVGKGNAVDIHLQFKDENNKPIGREKIDAYALLSIETEVYNQKLDKSFSDYTKISERLDMIYSVERYHQHSLWSGRNSMTDSIRIYFNSRLKTKKDASQISGRSMKQTGNTISSLQNSDKTPNFEKMYQIEQVESGNSMLCISDDISFFMLEESARQTLIDTPKGPRYDDLVKQYKMLFPEISLDD